MFSNYELSYFRTYKYVFLIYVFMLIAAYFAITLPLVFLYLKFAKQEKEITLKKIFSTHSLFWDQSLGMYLKNHLIVTMIVAATIIVFVLWDSFK